MDASRINPTGHPKQNKDADHLREEAARAYSAIFGFLASVFNQQPDINMLRSLTSLEGSFWAELREFSGSNPETLQGMSDISKFFFEVKTVSEIELEKQLGADWTRTFRGLGSGYGPKPPFEALFLGDGSTDINVMRSISQTYTDFNLISSVDVKNRPDYLGVEFDFLRYLTEKEAESWLDGEESKAMHYQTAWISFYNRHPRRWAEVFCDQAAQQAQTGFYRGLLGVVKGILQNIDHVTRTVVVD